MELALGLLRATPHPDIFFIPFMPKDIIAVLDEDQARLAELGRRVRCCAQPAAAITQFNDFAVALGGHLTAVKRVVYPALKAVGWKNVSSTLLVGHAKLTHAFADLLTLKKPSGVFAESLSDLLDATDHLLAREREDLLPILREELTPGTRIAMAAEAAHYLAQPRHAGRRDLVRQTVRDWIDEARLLLGGMRGEDIAVPDGPDQKSAPDSLSPLAGRGPG